MPSIVDRLSARVEIAHDTQGFGFNDRISVRTGIEENLVSCSSAGWTVSGKPIVLDSLEKDNKRNSNAKKPSK